MKLLLLLFCSLVFVSVNGQVKPKQVTITLDSAHLVIFLNVWQAGSEKVWDMNILAPIAKEWFRYSDSLFNANVIIYNSWTAKPAPPKKDSSVNLKK